MLLRVIDSNIIYRTSQSGAVSDRVKNEVRGPVGDIVQALKDRLLKEIILNMTS